MLNCSSCLFVIKWEYGLDNFFWCPIIRAEVFPEEVNCGRFCDFHSGGIRNEDFSDTS